MYVTFVNNIEQVIQFGEKIGSGRYGTVYSAKCIDKTVSKNMRDRQIAIKIVKRKDEYLREIDHSSMIRHHPGIIRLLAVYITNEDAILCFERAKCNLMRYLKSSSIGNIY